MDGAALERELHIASRSVVTAFMSISQHTMFFQNPKTRHIRAKAYVCPNTGKLSHRSACQCQCHCASCSAGAIAGAVLVPVPDTSGNELHMLLCIQVPIPTR